ncbi:hypothetical protein EDB92DRAFT_399473 [Lactarius akahatsu]|uniref:Uncharacterized protein n=1 Tax=Lactarius akahatsu TaxID=416441 RepID=A0AAD4LN99_9AGAM|nr:hypothetical protein EDB92DRAFT_883082 [Lactarius akahatsu]KAH8993402.1 hypothetical protein EDB92DRAFT_399473 [Lactarius akahatsu]
MALSRVSLTRRFVILLGTANSPSSFAKHVSGHHGVSRESPGRPRPLKGTSKHLLGQVVVSPSANQFLCDYVECQPDIALTAADGAL